jgi:HPt (histidine-containing phosphotransfer) domain-containing protein
MSRAGETDPVDLSHLARYTGGEAQLTAEVLQLFVAQAPTLLSRLEDTLAQREAKTWRETNHALKGAARGIGAFALGDAAASAEKLDIEREPQKAAAALKTLNRCSETVKLFVDAYLGR